MHLKPRIHLLQIGWFCGNAQPSDDETIGLNPMTLEKNAFPSDTAGKKAWTSPVLLSLGGIANVHKASSQTRADGPNPNKS